MSRAEHLKVVKNLLSNSVMNLREAAVAAGRAGDLEFGHDVTQIVFCADALLTRWNRGVGLKRGGGRRDASPTFMRRLRD